MWSKSTALMRLWKRIRRLFPSESRILDVIFNAAGSWSPPWSQRRLSHGLLVCLWKFGRHFSNIHLDFIICQFILM
jgi:hypothetical protein